MGPGGSGQQGAQSLPLPPHREQACVHPLPQSLSETISSSCLQLPPARALSSAGLRFPGWRMEDKCVLVALPLLTPPVCGPTSSFCLNAPS